MLNLENNLEGEPSFPCASVSLLSNENQQIEEKKRSIGNKAHGALRFGLVPSLNPTALLRSLPQEHRAPHMRNFTQDIRQNTEETKKDYTATPLSLGGMPLTPTPLQL